MSDLSREREIFERCLELSEGRRQEYLARVSSGAPALAGRVARLLQAHERVGEHALEAADVGLAILPDQVGPYRILRVLGQGGMGVVYEAEQREPVLRRVALKLVKPGLDRKKILARFDAERQALAFMNHPHIAKVLDAGSADRNRPYFVMELVDGIPLTDFCDRNRLSIRQRLELFILLCEAVQHAHQKGVLHRDLKPSNVLVEMQDGRPVPKVIDFGIAKAVGQSQIVGSMVTEAGTALGTPAYMSPEQADASALDVDTRADIYSLGVLLYELLAGAVPVDPREVGMAEFLSVLVKGDREVPTVTQKLEQMGPRIDSVAAARSTDPKELRQTLQGDLEWILAAALERDRERRYRTANALAFELRRFLQDEPVLARPPSLTYRFQKFLRRNRAVVNGVGVAILAVLLGIVGTTLGWIQAIDARREAISEATRALEAEQTANLRLRGSLVAQAAAVRQGNRAGRRYRSLELLSQAARIRPGNDLVDEAIASMALYDLRVVEEIPYPAEGVVSVEFSADCRLAALGTRRGTVEVLGLNGDGRRRTFSGFGPIPWVLAFSPGARFLAAKSHPEYSMEGSKLRLLRLETGEVEEVSPEPLGGSAFDFDSTGQWLAFGTLAGNLVLYDLVSQREVLRHGLASAPHSLRFSPDGKRLAVSLSGSFGIEILEAAGLHRIQTLRYSSHPYSLDWSSDGKRLAASYADGLAWIWDVAGGKRLVSLRGHQAEVVVVDLHPSEPLAVTRSWDETSRLWNAETGEELLVSTARARDFSGDGRYLSFARNDSFGLWEVLGGKELHTFYGHEGKNPTSAAFSRNGRWLVSGGSDDVLVRDAGTGRVLARASNPAEEAVFEPGRDVLYACSGDGVVRWNLEGLPQAGRLPRPERLGQAACRGIAVDSEGKHLVIAERERVRIVDLSGKAPERYLDAPPGLAGISISPGGEWIAGGSWRGDQTPVWNSQTGTRAATLLPGETAVSVLFSPDGKWLMTGSGTDYRMWRVGTWEEIGRIERPLFSRLPGKMSFSPDGEWVAVAIDNRTVRILDTRNQAAIANLTMSFPVAFTSFEFSPDRSRFVAATSARQIHVWKLESISDELRNLGLVGQNDRSWVSPGKNRRGRQPVSLVAP